MKLYRVDKLAKRGGLAVSDAQAVREAEDSPDCPICEIKRDGETVGQVF